MSSRLALVKNILIIIKRWLIGGKSIFIKIWEVNFFFSNILVPISVLVLYFVSFRFLLSKILDAPNGVNYVFASRSWRYFSLLLVGSCIIFFIIAIRKRGGKFTIMKSSAIISGVDLILILLPLTPVMQYIIKNQKILSPLGSLAVFFFFVFFSGIYIFAVPALLGSISSTRILTLLGLAFVFTITSMASLSIQFSWLESGSLWIQWPFLGIVFLVTWLFYSLTDKKILHFIVAVIFVTNSTVLLLTQDNITDLSDPTFAGNRLMSLVGEKAPVVTPNIYLLVYDAYVCNETMLAHGIDNSPQEEYLKEEGFTLYPHTYSVDRGSIWTMSRVLNASTNYYGNKRRGVSGDGVVQNLLHGFGYKTYGLFASDYFFLGIDSTYDFYFPEYNSSPDILLRAILMGEFRFDVGFNIQPREQFVATKQRIFKGVSEEPVFIYMHSNLPQHSQNSGVCLPDETDQYKTRLSRANIEMQEDISTIIENDPEAIIIVAGDHGPYLTKDCYVMKGYDISEISRLDLQDRFGTFLAIRWPTGDFSEYDEIIVLQDLFPSIFAYLLKDEIILDSKIEPVTMSESWVIRNGIILMGINDGEPLFVTDN